MKDRGKEVDLNEKKVTTIFNQRWGPGEGIYGHYVGHILAVVRGEEAD